MDDIQSWWEVPSIAHFCSLFRAAFNLLDFDIEELEEALLTDGAEDAGSSLLQELIVRLLCGCLANNDVSTFNYQMFLRRLFRQKYQECGRENPFNTDMDFQFLPLRTKVEILHALCDFRLDAEDVQDVLKNLDSDSLRIMPLGYDENNSAYWYFYGTRLYKEDYKPIQKKKAKEKRRKGKEDKRKKKHNKPVSDSDSEDLGTGIWQVACFTEHDWDKLTNVMRDSTSRVERSLYRTLSEDFLPEIPRLFAEKERLQRKRLLDYQPRRQSSRIEKLKQQKFEEQIGRDDEKLGPILNQDETSKSSLVSLTKDGRAARALHRSASQTGSDCGSAGSRENSQSSNRSSSRPVGRQTNNSLASATGPIVIQGTQRKLRSSLVFRQTEEDLQTGMYKILKTIKTHEDAWPFVDPVEEEYAPRYYSIVNKPMDLQRMEDKLDEGAYVNFNDFKTDFQLIVDNCRKYNGTENEYTEMVGNLEEAFRLAVDRYLESDPSSDEEVTVRFPAIAVESHQALKEKHRQRGLKVKEERASIPESTLSPETVSAVSPPPPEVYEKAEKVEKAVERADSESRHSSKEEDSLRQARGGPSKPKKKKVEVVKNAEAIQALELATEQTLKDINKWLDDTPRFSEYSSASNSPSHFITGEEFEIGGTKVESEYRQRLKLERPSKSNNNKEPGKRRATKDAPKPHPRREIQRTIERLQPGKSKGNLISNMQTLNAIKAAKEEEAGAAGKPKENRKEAEAAEAAAPKLSLGTVLTSDVLGFDVGKASHNFDAETKPEKGDARSDEEASQSSQEATNTAAAATAATAPEQLKVAAAPLVKPKKTEEASVKPEASAKANHSAWFKAFGAPKPATAPKPRRIDPPEERRPVAAVRPMAPLRPEPAEEAVRDLRAEIRSPDEVLAQPRSQEMDACSPHQARRQRKASTGSSMSERSSFSQDLTDPLDNSSSPRLMLDERLGGYSSAHYPSPMHRSPMAASPVMASPRTDEAKHPSYPPPNGTIRVGFYQDTSSAFPKASPDRSAPPPSYTPRAFPGPDYTKDHDAGGGGFLPYQSVPPAAAPHYDGLPAPPYSLMHYYDTSKPLTDQYQAARTQTTTNVSPSYANSVQKGFAQKPVIPVKKRMYTEVEPSAIPQQQRYHQAMQQTMHNDQIMNGMQPSMMASPQGKQVPPMGYEQMPSAPVSNPVPMASRQHQMSNVGEKVSQSMGLPQYGYPGMEMPQKELPQPAQAHLGHQGMAGESGRGQAGMHVGYRGPYTTAPSMGNLANLSHIVDRYSTEERLLQMQPPFYGDKGMFAQAAPTTMQASMSSPMFQQTPSISTAAYNRDTYNRPELSAMLSSKAPPMQPEYNRNVSDLGAMMPNKPASPLDMQAVYNRPDLSSMLQNKTSAPAAYNRPASDLSMLPNRPTPPLELYNSGPDLTTLMSGKGNAPLPYNRTQMTDYAMLPSKAPETQPPAKPARKRKTKASVAAAAAAAAAAASAEATGFQHYTSAKATEQPIALKTASVVPGSAFNFGPAPPAMGLYGEKDGYSNFMEDYRTAPTGYYMPEPSRDKTVQGSSPAFPFLSHPQPRPPPYPQLAQAFINHHQPLMDSGSYPYFHRHQEELLRHSSNPMVLHQGLLAPPTSYPPGYHPALGMRQPYDPLNRSSWL